MDTADEWVDCLTIHAAIMGLGRRSDVADVQRLRDACAAANLGEAARVQVLGAFDRFDRALIHAALRRLHDSQLRFALLADACQMARAVGIERVDRDPALVTLSRLLAITPAQHEAICRFIAASTRPQDPGWGGWRSQMDDLRAALQRVQTTGATTGAVAGVSDRSRTMPNLAGGSFLGVIRLIHELTLS